MDGRFLSVPRVVVFFVAVFATSLPAADLARADETSDLADATEHLQRGRYEEAAEAFTEILNTENEDTSSAAIIGLSRALESQGEYKESITRLTEIAKPTPAVLAEAARLQFTIGRLEEAAASCEAALKADADQAMAHLVLAWLSTEAGDLKKANEAFRWFVRFYNRKQSTDAETLLLIAEGAGEYARWNSIASIFNFIINTLCVDALKDDPLSWQTHLASGSLLLEKYNRAQAIPDLKKALEINPRAVAVIVALGEAALQKHDIDAALTYAEQALNVQANYVPTLRLMADIALNKHSPDAALLALEEARKTNPFDSETLGRLGSTFNPAAKRMND